MYLKNVRVLFLSLSNIATHTHTFVYSPMSMFVYILSLSLVFSYFSPSLLFLVVMYIHRR